VDDITSVRFYHTTILEKAGFECLAANNGKDALAAMQKRPVDLLILDLDMPDMNGEALLEKLGATPVLARVPVLIVSFHSFGAKFRRIGSSKAGPVGFAQKPTLPEQFFAELERLLA
jgi:DNA-binding response OmpR family regulator